MHTRMKTYSGNDLPIMSALPPEAGHGCEGARAVVREAPKNKPNGKKGVYPARPIGVPRYVVLEALPSGRGESDARLEKHQGRATVGSWCGRNARCMRGGGGG